MSSVGISSPGADRRCASGIGLFLLLLLPAVGQAQSPDYQIRGMLPWHNFLSGPTAWNEDDWEHYLDWMHARDLNLLVLHCYTGGAQRYATYVEPMIRIEYRGVVPAAGFDTSLTARWGYRPLAVSDFAFGTAALFQPGAGAFGSRAATEARTNRERYDRAQTLIRRVFAMAHERGIRVAMGFEFGVYPPELYSVIPPASWWPEHMLPDPTHPASREILQRTIDDILRAYPDIDWIWLWLQELHTSAGALRASPEFQKQMKQDAPLFADGADDSLVLTGVWSLAYIRAAHRYLAERAPKVRLAVSGWGGQLYTDLLATLNKGLPPDIVLACLNPAQGARPQPAVFKEIAAKREAIIIPWLEGDARLWHAQPRVTALRDQLRLGREQGVQGSVAIHWRTEDIRPNMEAYARFVNHPDAAPTVEEFYRQDALARFGPGSEAIADLLARMDRERWFDTIDSPEYFPYSPGWGRLTAKLRSRLESAEAQVEEFRGKTADEKYQANLAWLAATLRFTLLLDEVSRAIAPAYQLRDRAVVGPKPTAGELEVAARAFNAAPIEELFRTYAARVRSRGELGVLSALNQKLWTQYVDLQRFLDAASQSQ